MEPISGRGETTSAAELLQAQSGLWNHIFRYIDSMSLKCAVELGIPDILHRHGRPISLSELSAALAVPPPRLSHLARVMRLLTHSGIFSTQRKGDAADDDDEDLYVLTPISRLLIKGIDGCLSPFLLAELDPVLVTPFQSMGAWFRSDAPTPFTMAHGCGVWDVANRNPRFNQVFNAGMASDSCFLLDVLIKECSDMFRGLRSLVDVGGGTGSAARAIAEAFPQVKCSVLDLPHVVDTALEAGTVAFIAGDMFEYVPPADAVLLKWILHDWCDEDCVKILRRCKAAIPCREEGGRVVIIDVVIGSKDSHHESRETQLYLDMLMMVECGGAERDEQEWKKLFIEAGFTDYKITSAFGLRSVIEVYP